MAGSGSRKLKDWDALCEFLTNHHSSKSVSECTDVDAFRFLQRVPSHRIKAAVSNLSAVFQALVGSHKANPFDSPTVKRLLDVFEKENLFEKCLTDNDVHNGLVIAKKHFSFAAAVRGTDRFEAKDEDGKPWTFDYRYANQSYMLTNGWSSYIKVKQLGAGDFVYFQRHPTDDTRLFISYRRSDDAALRDSSSIVRDFCLVFSSETKNNLKGPRLQLESILSLLHPSQSSSPQIVGFWGMAGIGKTTISEEIFTTQAERYDVCYFLPNFHLVCQTKGLSHLRHEFLSKIFGEDKVFIDACDTKLCFSRDRFLDKRVLIVLDGVANVRDAEDLIGGFGWFSGGHTIILTSRNRQVLVQCNAKEIYEIQKLSEPESFQLCSHYATEENRNGRTSLISELVSYASGIPLALQVLGSSVQRECITSEEEHLRRLRQHPPIKIHDAFSISFDGLDDNEKSTFLDLACFFKGENKDHVVNILDGCGYFTNLGICGLIDKSLISLVDNTIEMPDIFQDTGRFVVYQENNEAGKRSRLWDPNDIVDVLKNNLGTEAVKSIYLNASDLMSDLSPSVFEKMYRLRLLKFHYPSSENHSKVCLPHGLSSLPDELRLLHWERYPLGSLPRNFNPKNLVELNMPYSNLTKLWKGTKDLRNLKRIILSHSRNLTKFPRLSKAMNLEYIDLEGCVNLVKVNSSIVHHRKLTFLSLKDCSSLRKMPTTIHLESLEVLNLSGCSEIEELHDFSPNLKELYLAGTAITEIPSSVRDQLVTLEIDASVMESLRKRKWEKSVSGATNISKVQHGSASICDDHSDNISWRSQVLSESPGQPKLQNFMKTGNSHHPRYTESSVHDRSLSPMGLPLWPGQPLCDSYFRTGKCDSGPDCIYDHPPPLYSDSVDKPFSESTSSVILDLNQPAYAIPDWGQPASSSSLFLEWEARNFTSNCS